LKAIINKNISTLLIAITLLASGCQVFGQGSKPKPKPKASTPKKKVAVDNTGKIPNLSAGDLHDRFRRWPENSSPKPPLVRIGTHIITNFTISYDNAGKPQVIRNTFEEQLPEIIDVKEPQFYGDLLQYLPMLGTADSAVIKVPSVDFWQGNAPVGIPLKGFVTFNMKVERVLNDAEMAVYNDSILQLGRLQYKQLAQDTTDLLNLIGADRANYYQTNEGVYVKILDVGTGELAQTGDYVTIRYKLFTTDGTLIDERMAENTNLRFQLAGTKKVILGLQSALVGVRVGTAMKIYIPSLFAYDKRGRKGIAPNTNVMMEVYLIRVEPGL